MLTENKFTTVRFPVSQHWKLKEAAAQRRMNMETLLLEAFQSYIGRKPAVNGSGKLAGPALTLAKIIATRHKARITAVSAFLDMVEGL